MKTYEKSVLFRVNRCGRGGGSLVNEVIRGADFAEGPSTDKRLRVKMASMTHAFERTARHDLSNKRARKSKDVKAVKVFLDLNIVGIKTGTNHVSISCSSSCRRGSVLKQ